MSWCETTAASTRLNSDPANHLPYGRQCVDEADIAAVVAALRSDWLTTGPRVAEFERAVADLAGSRHAVAVSSGTAALHAAMFALGIRPGDEVVVPPMTFAATANCVVYQGGCPVFADVDPGTLLLDPDCVAARITPRTRAIIAVDYAGQPCDGDALRTVADRHGLALVTDGCHALGATYNGRPAGSAADLTAFSFHPVKHITTGEGGMVTTDNAAFAERMRRFRNHGITTDHRRCAENGTWRYEIHELGFNYRITDFQCALGLSQLQKLPDWIARRRALAGQYDAALAAIDGIDPLQQLPGRQNVYHLYVVQVDTERYGLSRDALFDGLRAQGIGVQVHYIPLHFHPYYRDHPGAGPGSCPKAEAAYARILSLPMFPAMPDAAVARVVAALRSQHVQATGTANRGC